MSIFPTSDGFIAFPPDDHTLQAARAGDTPAFDFETGRFILQDGSPELRSGAPAVRQWFELMLRTYLGRYKVYEGQTFGHSAEDLIGTREFPDGFIRSEIEREIVESAAQNPAIKSTFGFSFARNGRSLEVSCTVELQDGEQVEVSYVT